MLRKLVPLIGQPLPCPSIIITESLCRVLTALVGVALESLGIDLHHGVSSFHQWRRIGSRSMWSTSGGAPVTC